VPAPTHNRPLFRAPAVIFWAGFLLRVATILIGHTYRIRVPMDHFGFGWEMGRIARSLVLGQGYANPFNGHTGPTAWTPPLYPLLIALSFKLFGIYTNAAAIFLLVCNSLFSAAIAPAVYEIAARTFDAPGLARRHSKLAAPVAMWSAWLWAVYPAALQYAIHWIWEMSLSTFLLAWLIVLTLRLRGTGEAHGTNDAAEEAEPSKGHGFSRAEKLENAVILSNAKDPCISPKSPRLHPEATPTHPLLLWSAFGLLWGLLALSNASLLLCLPAMALWAAWPNLRILGKICHLDRRSAATERRDPCILPGAAVNHTEGKQALRQDVLGATLAALIFCAVLAPWVVRNQRALHAFVPTRANFGVELYNSSLPSNDGLPWGTAMPLWSGDPVIRQYTQMGEVPFAKMRQQQAIANLRAEPRLFTLWTLNRVLFFWDGTPHPPDRHPALEYLRVLSYSFLSACGLLGLALMLRRRVPGAGLFALIFLLVPVAYYIVTVQARFRHPIEPLIAILGVYLFRSAETRKTNPAHSTVSVN
jgi:hypothetical protein